MTVAALETFQRENEGLSFIVRRLMYNQVEDQS